MGVEEENMSKMSFYDAIDFLERVREDILKNENVLEKTCNKDTFSDAIIMVTTALKWLMEKQEFKNICYRIYSPVGLYLCYCDLGINIRWTLDIEDSVIFDTLEDARKVLNLIPKAERVADGIVIEEFVETRKKIEE